MCQYQPLWWTHIRLIREYTEEHMVWIYTVYAVAISIITREAVTRSRWLGCSLKETVRCNSVYASWSLFYCRSLSISIVATLRPGRNMTDFLFNQP